MAENVLEIVDLGKRYRIGGARVQYGSLREALAGAVRRPIHRLRHPGAGGHPSDTFWALSDVSFSVARGELVGVIGRNGAGKTTLLKILSRVTSPTRGQVGVRGRVGSLLEVGTGFHPELTGRENVYLSGAILGMRRAEIRDKFDAIVEFSEIAKFIDTPVKRFSSGMYVRLAFAVAAHLEPEILLVDEVLAVGDAAFQRKCLGKMGDVAQEGRTVLFVSHSMTAIRQLTHRSLLLDEGCVVADGRTADVVERYTALNFAKATNTYDLDGTPRRFRGLPRTVEFVSLELENAPGGQMVPAGDDINVLARVRAKETVERFRFSVDVLRADGTAVGNAFSPLDLCIAAGEIGTYRVTLSDLRLAPGRYHCAFAVGRGDRAEGRAEFDVVLEVVHFEVMPEQSPLGGVESWEPTWGSIRFPAVRAERIG